MLKQPLISRDWHLFLAGCLRVYESLSVPATEQYDGFRAATMGPPRASGDRRSGLKVPQKGPKTNRDMGRFQANQAGTFVFESGPPRCAVLRVSTLLKQR